MVQLSENEGSNQQRGNKRTFSNAGDDNQGGQNPRGDHGGKFQRRSFGDRGPFNKGGDRPFNNGNRFNRGGPFNKDNNFNRGRNQNFGQGRNNQNFNRGRDNQNFQGRNNQNFRKGGFQNNRFNKSWEENRNDNAPDFEQNDGVTKHKKFEGEIEEAGNTVDTQPKNKKSKNTAQNEDEASSSDGDQEVETSVQNNQKAKENEEETSSENEEEIGTNANLQENQIDEDDETSSESEEEIETVSKTVQKVHKNEEEEISSSEDEEETVTNSNNVQNNQGKNEDKKKSADEIEANNSQELQVKIAPATNEDNTSTTEKQNKETRNKGKGSRTVYVGSLPASATEQQIKKFFKRYGKIEHIEFGSTEDEYSAVSIIFEKIEGAKKAVEVNGMMYKNHRLNVFIRNGRKRTDNSTSVFVREIPDDITLTDLWDAFESTYGPVRDIVLPILPKIGQFKHTDYAFIEFQAADSKELAVTDKQIIIKGKIIKVIERSEQKKSDRTILNKKEIKKTPRALKRTQKFEPRRFTGGPRYSNEPRRFSGKPRNSSEPRDFAGAPGNIKVHNTPGNSITISLGNDSFQGRPSFNGRPKFNPRNSKGCRQ